jgi:hypothetical protein
MILVLLVYSSISLFNVYAVPPAPGYDSSKTCGAPTTLGDISQKTCCWTEKVPGKLPPNNNVNYCQTCRVNSADVTLTCKDPVQQLRPSPNGVSPNEGVLEQPTVKSPKGNDAINPFNGGSFR